MELTESVLQFHGCDLLLRRGGKGPPVLFLHGAGGTNPTSLPFYEKLTPHFDLLVPDHPSYGRSSTPEWLEEIPDLAYFYLDLIEHLGLTNVHVIGHSMGGWLSLEMAIRSTERIASLTLMSSVGIRIKGKPVANLFIMDPPQLMNALYADKKIVDEMLAVTPTQEMLDEIVKNRIASARLAWQPRFFNPKLEKWLSRVRLPTQIIWGAEDALVPPAYAPRFKELIPQAEVTMLEGVGHVPQYEATDKTASAIIDFIKRHV
jgi:pimeloyl-ACP methyl ester carboxylesterase